MPAHFCHLTFQLYRVLTYQPKLGAFWRHCNKYLSSSTFEIHYLSFHNGIFLSSPKNWFYIPLIFIMHWYIKHFCFIDDYWHFTIQSNLIIKKFGNTGVVHHACSNVLDVHIDKTMNKTLKVFWSDWNEFINISNVMIVLIRSHPYFDAIG